MTLPTVIMKFRQGLGRLVRRHDDHGDILILDSRIVRKGYGKEFLAEMPKSDYEAFRLSEHRQI